MNLAFKEWSFIVDALGKGYQSLILRKGGISEEEGNFTLKGNKFLLLPTLYHQAKQLIKPDWLPRLDENKFQLGNNTVQLSYYVQVIDNRIITDWNILQKLDSQHAWKEEIIQERFNRWDKSVHLLLLQVYALKKPVELELKPEYEGCKSWVTLDHEVDGAGTPVIYEKIKGTYF